MAKRAVQNRGRENDSEKKKSQKEDRNSFITVDDLHDKGNTKAKITGKGIRIWSKPGGGNLILEIQIGKEEFRDLSVPIGRPSHRTLENLLGKDMSVWGGEWIELYANDKWVNVFDPNYQPNEPKGRTRKSDLPF